MNNEPTKAEQNAKRAMTERKVKNHKARQDAAAARAMERTRAKSAPADFITYSVTYIGGGQWRVRRDTDGTEAGVLSQGFTQAWTARRFDAEGNATRMEINGSMEYGGNAGPYTIATMVNWEK